MGKSRTGSTLTHPTSSVSLSIIRQESRLILTNNNNHVILEDKPVHDSETDYSLVIPYRAHSSKSKDDTTIVLEQSSKLTIADGKVFERPVFAVLGVLPLVASNYLVVVTDRVKVGSLFGKHDVFCIKKAEIIPIASDSMIENMNETQAKEDAQYIFMISTFLNSGSFFFSHTYDLSNTMERHQKLSKVQQPETDIHPTWNYVDNRFVWNQHLAGPLLPFSKSFGNWFPPTIQGYVTVHNEMRIADNSFSFALISRRNKNRAGTRYHTRGADKEGNVAAYVETEQILVFPTSSGPQYTSFVQTRGSIPLFWKQDINLAYEPPIVVDHEDDTALKTHFSEQINFYNKQVILNLVKKKGAEKALGYAYKKTVRAWNNEKIRYIGFDVYQHCKGDYAKLSRLINKIQGDMLEMGYFSMDSTNTIKKSQTGVFRTNCKDCLDRTNLVQGLLARLNMIQVLKDFNYIKDENDVEKTSFMTLYRCCWADNGDAISITYAGTPALKGDVTRTGKRSVQGMLDDGFNAITRYYVNNFQDGVKQDAMDLFLGNIAVGNTRNLSSSAVRSEGLIIIAWIVTIFNIIAPLQTRYKYHQMFLVAMVLLVVIFVAKLFRLSKKVVNIPKLPRQIKQKLG